MRWSGPLAVEVLLHPLGEVLDGEAEVVLAAVDPLLDRVLALPQRLREGGDDFVPVEFPGVALF